MSRNQVGLDDSPVDNLVENEVDKDDLGRQITVTIKPFEDGGSDAIIKRTEEADTEEAEVPESLLPRDEAEEKAEQAAILKRKMSIQVEKMEVAQRNGTIQKVIATKYITCQNFYPS